MKRIFVEHRFSQDRLRVIHEANAIIERYQEQGFTLTLRQLFYQLVSQNLLPNSEHAYKNLGAVISDGRLAGLIDWEAIEDRVRVPWQPPEFENLDQLVEAALASYRLPRWKGQARYVELWVEKDALAGVLRPMASEFHVTLMVNRGYSSQSAMFEAAARFRTHQGQDCVLLYLGDHDPSGEDMVRDIGARLELFGVEVEVRKIALTMPQVKHYKPPPNPAKLSDSRTPGYIMRHGASSWEVDALPPEVLQQLIRQHIADLVDKKLMDQQQAQEKKDKQTLRKALR